MTDEDDGPPGGRSAPRDSEGVSAGTYAYHQQILDELARHGLRPLPTTPPHALRDAVRDLYKYEIKVARAQLLAGRIERRHYAAHILALRRRYPLLSIPTELWTSGHSADA